VDERGNTKLQKTLTEEKQFGPWGTSYKTRRDSIGIGREFARDRSFTEFNIVACGASESIGYF